MEKYVIAIIGTGYVGLETAAGFATANQPVIAFDIDEDRINTLKHHIDINKDVDDISSPLIHFTHKLDDIKSANYYIITVPTPVDSNKKPQLNKVISAAEEIGPFIKPQDTVICESTVYPGTTEEVVLPILESKSGLKAGIDFYLGYSSERINPSDSNHRFNKVAKVYAGLNAASYDKLKNLYELAIHAPLFAAKSIKVAETSKLLENIQRDVNIALMNEFVQVTDKLGISLLDVIDAAATKWNFVPYTPGFVGGHCIAVDPYYLIERAKQNEVETPLMSTARMVNDGMVEFIYQKAMAFLSDNRAARVAICGLSYKQNMTDIRNSLAIQLYNRFNNSDFNICAVDPCVIPEQLDFLLTPISQLTQQDLVIICVPHNQFKPVDWTTKLTTKGGMIDLPGLLRSQQHVWTDRYYWSP